MELYRLVFDGGALALGMYGSYQISKGHKFRDVIAKNLRFTLVPDDDSISPDSASAEFITLIEGLRCMEQITSIEQRAEINLKIYTDNSSLRILVNGGGMVRKDTIRPFYNQVMLMLSQYEKYGVTLWPRYEMVKRFGH